MIARLLAGALASASLFLCSTPAAAQEAADPIFAEWRDRVDPAIDNALQYLARVQRSDGTFPENYGDSTGIPALVGMTFLSRGHTPMEGPYAETINRCIDFVLNNQKANGLFEKGHAGSGPMYAHNISTLFISEVSGMVDPARQEKIEKTLPRALKVILEAQAVKKDPRHQGGWRYHPGSTDSDTSCSGWALMALRSAKLNGAAVPDQAIADAVAYLKRRQDQERGCFGYTGTTDHAKTLTGMGLLCLELCGLHGSSETEKAADYVMKTFRDLPGDQFEFYGNYYNAQGMFQIGGNYWAEYAAWMYDNYLGKQNDDGSWNSREAGRIYGTAMMTLAFTVPYRQLPIYQRDETVDELDL
jgi:hypothetical protein